MTKPVEQATAPDRNALLADLVTTRTAFRELLASVDERRWRQPSLGTAWTNGQVMVHVVDSLARLPTEIEHARRGRDFLKPPAAWLRPVFSRIAWLVTCSSARGQSPASALAGYEAAHAAALATIAGIGDDEWQLGAQFFGDGFRTILDRCRLPNSHFREHAKHVR
jgi:hypothetical protein